MSELRKANTDHPYFVTPTVVGWIDIFTRSMYAEIILESLRHLQTHKDCELYAYVIMPSHLHFIARHRQGNLGKVLGEFKSYTAKQILKAIQNNSKESRKDWLIHMFKYHAKYQKMNHEFVFWQKTTFPILCDTSFIFDQKVEYIHNNPVKAGIVEEPYYYRYSSANPESELKMDGW